MEKSYYEIALDNLEFLESSLCDSHYNDLGPLAEQVAEKMLKSVLTLEVVDVTSILQSHNLKNIYTKIQEAGVDLNLCKKDLSMLKDVYFDARYPGENYIDVNQEDCADYVRIMYDVVSAVNVYRASRALPFKPVVPKELGYCDTDSIDSVFNQYRNKFNIIDDSKWAIELGRLFIVFGTTDMATLSRNIKETFL